MKKKNFKFKLIAFVCFLTINIYGQTLTKQHYSELARLFAKDVQLKGDPRENYMNYQSTHVCTPFSHSKVLSLNENRNGNRDIEKVLVIVHSLIYSQLTEKINRYASDISRVYDCEVIMETVSGGDHTNIKNLIISHQTNLSGVVFIGDIAPAWYEVENDFGDYGYAIWPCDLYYMDINGTWHDYDGNGIYDAHTGDIKPEIFVGRISTANMGKLLPEKEGLERYLDKNHNFWIGNTTVNKQFGLTYTDHDWAIYNDMKTDIRHLYGNSNYDQIKYGDPGFGKKDYLNRLKNNRYEFIQLACHANHEFLQMSGGDIFANEIYYNGSEAIGYNLFSCSACDWTAVSPNSNRGFLGGVHAYNANNSSLVVVGSTKTGSMLAFDKFYIPLGQGKTIGESLKQWWVDAFGNTHDEYVVSWHYGMSIIGDPMINFHYNCLLTWKIGYPVAADVVATFDDGTLTITGAGAMMDWNSQKEVPWYFLKDEITDIIMGNGITTIGKFAFSGCNNLAEIHAQNSIPPTLGEDCFEGINQEVCLLYVPNGAQCAYDTVPVWQEFNIVGLPFTITLTVENGGGGGVYTVHCGDDITVCFLPHMGFEIHEVWVDGVLNTQALINGCLTFVNVNSNHEVLIIFKLIDSINDEIANQISIFPNPAQNELTIETGELKIENIKIYDLKGHEIFKSQFYPESSSRLNSQFKINVSAFQQGIYLLNIYTDKGVLVRKFVKE